MSASGFGTAADALATAFGSGGPRYIDATHPSVVPSLLDACESNGVDDALHEDVAVMAIGHLAFAHGWVDHAIRRLRVRERGAVPV